MKFFSMDLHISVIADFKTANPDVEVIDWCLSGHAWVMKRQQDYPKIINPHTWMNLNEQMISDFQKEYDSFLNSFDGFITGHVSAFAMIYEKYNKPILMINTCRYDLPFCWTKNFTMLASFHECLQRLQKANRLLIVSNNRADQIYTYTGTGILPDYNPSLCLYTNTSYSPTKNTFVCYTGNCPEHSLIKKRPDNFSWNDISQYKGVIYFPYEASLMSMFEHYTAGYPMFLPSKQYWKSNSSNIHSVSKYWGELPDYLCAMGTDFWIDNSDVYTLFSSPNTYYFDSIDHLFALLETFEYKQDDRKEYIQSVKTKWNELMNTLLTARYKNQYPQHLCYNRLPLLANVVYDCDYTNSGVQAQHTYPFHYPFTKGDVVFVKTDYLDWFIKNCSIDAPITLITGVSDLSPREEQYNYIVNHPNVKQWIGCNISQSHPKITKILIGVGEPERPNGNHETLMRLHKNRPNWNEKRNEVCIPYHSNTHESRTSENMLPKLAFEDYMQEIGQYKFVRCMRGNGLDTHRFCEILLMGSVPVIDHSSLDDLYEQFPCMFVGDHIASFSWDDKKYQSFLDMFWLSPHNKHNIVKSIF